MGVCAAGGGTRRPGLASRPGALPGASHAWPQERNARENGGLFRPRHRRVNVHALDIDKGTIFFGCFCTADTACTLAHLQPSALVS